MQFPYMLRQTVRWLKPQPPVLDRETISRATFLRSIFMQGELGSMDEPDWRVEAETQQLIERTYQ
jgi:hypothetical protein